MRAGNVDLGPTDEHPSEQGDRAEICFRIGGNLYGLSLKIERRAFGNNEHIGNLGQLGYDEIGNPVTKILLPKVSTHITERKNSD